MANTTESRRYRISIPLDDPDVVEWLDAQRSISMSLRVLIHSALLQTGIRDYFSTGTDIPPTRGRGRPRGSKNKPKTDEDMMRAVQESAQAVPYAAHAVPQSPPVSQLMFSPPVEQPVVMRTAESGQAPTISTPVSDGQPSVAERLARMQGLMNK